MSDIVLLDFGGTLDGDGVPWSLRFFAFYREAGGRLPAREFEAAFRETDRALARLPGVRILGFRATIEVQASLLAALLPPGSPDLRPVTERFYQDSLATVERNRAVLAELRAAGHRLGVIANFSGNLARCLDELGLTACFETIADSGVVGVSKPDPRIFRAALDALGGAGEDHCWMVGDNPDADIRPAIALGCSTAWVAPRARPLPPGLQPTVRLTSLAGLPDAIRDHERADTRCG